jgi:hypothetical protein
MRIIVAVACMLGLVGALPAHAAELKDVFGRAVPLGQGRPAVVLYANPDTREVLRTHAFQFAYQLRREYPIMVVHVDLRDVPSFFRGAARRELRKSHRESIAAIQKLFQEQGQQPPDNLETSLYLVADSTGAPHHALGLEKGFLQVLAQALSPSGLELARGRFPESAPSIGRAIQSSLAPSLLSSANSR